MSSRSEHHSPLITAVRALLALVPILALLVGPFFLNRTRPFILGLPFLLFWISAWAVIAAAAMGGVYWLDPRRRSDAEDPR
ncbi:MAG: DUF3311 domain-containing protein [Gammaproteobacteria bacterium]